MKNNLFIKAVFLITLCLPFFTSCSDDNSDGGEGNAASLTISVDQNNIVSTSNDAFNFTVKDEAGNDVTSESTIYVAGSAIEGASYITDEIGSYDVYATRGDLTSNSISISVALSLFSHNLLIEDYTGTWCGWCPRVMEAIERVKEQNQNVVVAALHSGDEYNFPPLQEPLNTLWTENGINPADGGLPTAGLNRLTLWTYPETTNIDQALNLIEPNSPYGIAISSDLGSNDGTVDVSFAFSTDVTSELKYVVYVAENGLIADQENYTGFFDGVDVLVDFEHDHAVRAVANDNIMGTVIPSENTVAGGEYSVSLNTNYTSENAGNLEVIAFIMDADGNVLNAQSAAANTSLDYQIIE